MLTENVHRIPVRMWRKWDERARYTFNQTYEYLMGATNLLPSELRGKRVMTDAQWRVMIWNIAFQAADMWPTKERWEKMDRRKVA